MIRPGVPVRRARSAPAVITPRGGRASSERCRPPPNPVRIGAVPESDPARPGPTASTIALATIHQRKYFTIQYFRASAYVRVIRSDTPFESISDAIKGLSVCRLALANVDAEQHGILFDWRSAPLSTDPNLHKALVEHIDGLAMPYARRAFLVCAGVGMMQVNRVSRTLSSNVLNIFDDEAEALEFLGQH